MKILQINTEKGWRGGERQTLYHLKPLQRQGLEVTLMCRRQAPLHERAAQQGVRVVPVSGQAQALRYLIVHGREYDILHAQTSRSHNLAVLSRFFHKSRVVYTRRVDFVQRGAFKKWIYSKTDAIVAISEAIRKILRANGVDQTTLIHVIPSVVVPKKLDGERARKLQQKFAGKRILATTSALVAHKDPLTMVEAVAHLAQQRNDFVFCHFGQGQLRDEVAKAIEHKGLQEVYHLMGFVEQVEDFFPAFFLFAMSSVEEGLGSSVLDAFLYRIPVVATEAGGLAETVNGYGLLCPVKDSACLAEKMDTLLTDPNFCDFLTERAYDWVYNNYSLSTSVEEYIKLYHYLMPEGSSL